MFGDAEDASSQEILNKPKNKIHWKDFFAKLNYHSISFKEFFGLFAVVVLLSMAIRLLALSIVGYLQPSLFFIISNQQLVDFCTTNSCKFFESISIILVTPLLEEFLFRGYILNKLLHKLGIKKALFITTFLFALVHGFDFIGIIPVGLVLGYLFLKYKNLLIPIAFHALANLLAVLIQLASPHSNNSTNPQIINELQSGIWLYAVITVIFSFILFKYLPKKLAQLELPLKHSSLDQRAGRK